MSDACFHNILQILLHNSYKLVLGSLSQHKMNKNRRQNTFTHSQKTRKRDLKLQFILKLLSCLL